MNGSIDDFPISSDMLDCKITGSDPWAKALNIDFGKSTIMETSLTSEEIQSSISDFRLEPQEEGGFVVFSREYSGAVGQGETIEEAIADIQSAIKVLKEVAAEDAT